MRWSILVLAVAAATACSKQTPDDAAGNNAASAHAAVAPAGNAAANKDASPSFDCARADGQAQELICSDTELAAMDRELARLYALAEADPQMPKPAQAELKAMQRGWVKGRDDCWKADDLRQCVVSNYAERIHRLRQGSKAARADVPQSISVGPLAYRCEGLGALIGATYINSEPGAVFLEWGPNDAHTLKHAMSGSGARYTAPVQGGEMVFWNKGKDATLTVPGKPDYKCTEDEIG